MIVATMRLLTILTNYYFQPSYKVKTDTFREEPKKEPLGIVLEKKS